MILRWQNQHTWPWELGGSGKEARLGPREVCTLGTGLHSARCPDRSESVFGSPLQDQSVTLGLGLGSEKSSCFCSSIWDMPSGAPERGP